MAVDLLREALLRVFAKKNEIRVVGSNSYSPAIHAQIVTTAPAIIVLDSSGLSHPSEPFARESSGYVLKDASAIELVSTISRWPRKKQSAHHP